MLCHAHLQLVVLRQGVGYGRIHGPGKALQAGRRCTVSHQLAQHLQTGLARSKPSGANRERAALQCPPIAHLVAGAADIVERSRGACAVLDSVHALVPGGPQPAAMQRVAKLVGRQLRSAPGVNTCWEVSTGGQWRLALPARGAVLAAVAARIAQRKAVHGRKATREAGLVHLIPRSVQRERGICDAVHHPPSNGSKARCVVLLGLNPFRSLCTG